MLKSKYNDPKNPDSELVIDDRPPHKSITVGELKRRAARESANLASSAPRQMDEDLVVFHLKSVAGRILTLVDGMLPQGSQNTALKTLIKKEFREQFSRTFGYFHDDACVQSGQILGEVEVFEKA